MNFQDRALEFLKCFCDGNIDGLSNLLAEDFCFKGPFIDCDSKEAYIASLKEDPPNDCQVEVIRTFENADEVGIFYIFSKENISTPMAQYFKFDKGEIIETLLVFDSRVFDEKI